LYATLKKLQAAAETRFSVRLLHIYPPWLLIIRWQDDGHPDWRETDCPYGGHASVLSLLFIPSKYIFNAHGSDDYWLRPFQEGREGQRPFVRITFLNENITLFIFLLVSGTGLCKTGKHRLLDLLIADIDVFCSWGISKGKLGYVFSMYYLFPLTNIHSFHPSRCG
jgi:hypothetical protein